MAGSEDVTCAMSWIGNSRKMLVNKQRSDSWESTCWESCRWRIM